MPFVLMGPFHVRLSQENNKLDFLFAPVSILVSVTKLLSVV